MWDLLEESLITDQVGELDTMRFFLMKYTFLRFAHISISENISLFDEGPIFSV